MRKPAWSSIKDMGSLNEDGSGNTPIELVLLSLIIKYTLLNEDLHIYLSFDRSIKM